MRLIRVVVIDDSAYNRRTITKMLEEIEAVEVVGYAANGEEGLKRVIDLRPDLITLDLEMPRMDGFTMLRIMMNSCPTPTIVISANSEDERVFKALELGAADFIAKPTSTISEEIIKIKEDLFAKVRNVFNLNVSRLRRHDEIQSADDRTVRGVDLHMPLKPELVSRFEMLAIGSSTGGPPALQAVFASLPAELPYGVAVSQHMPPGFTRAFAERLNRTLPYEVIEAEDGDYVRPNRVLIAPGGKNLVFQKVPDGVVARTVQPSSSDRYIPSVDAMFSSLATIFGPRLLSVVLTGMGNDGSKGVMAVKAAGGEVMAEAEDSAVVFGMPREAIATGVVTAIAPIELMGREIALHSGLLKYSA
ncbi:chemotaxis response regulator protein-glutamate methylesterase of group 3 operon [Geobacter sp. OR-1]|uniref:chemotaxis-specific protein-glutamate methyltransferase CheB n=1 Tax=Geobacter sp. OR-1 TaxID=1266765 RepID=UPI000543A54B|nr:chemotaxis-specific protein-glutamate methyltransferase CheB [Geobacter sp. OR-1]GAM08184.1 chemotaxis response regulator protein-glutamate methylesterase of group 3 operon [Geobacter sp. OR-1]